MLVRIVFGLVVAIAVGTGAFFGWAARHGEIDALQRLLRGGIATRRIGLAQAGDGNGGFIVHAPRIWGGRAMVQRGFSG